jgi:Mg-chelatase subunit ChlD
VDWERTIRKNLHHYLPERRTLIAEQVFGHGRRRSGLRDVILCVDQSGSMASSVVYASIFGAVMASLRAVRTRFVVFDTAVADLTDELDDPVDLLFGTQLGGGTDIQRAVRYCEGLIREPSKTVLVLITDLYEGGDRRRLERRLAYLVESGVTAVCLLALSDQGAPSYDKDLGERLAALGVPSFACTPELFPDLMAAAIQRQALDLWAARNALEHG